MSEENPYTTPVADPLPIYPVAGMLATPGERFVGALIDGLIGVGVAIPLWGILFFIGVIGSMKDMAHIGIPWTLALMVVNFAIIMAIQLPFLKATGQTVGKKVAKTRIADMQGGKPSVTNIIFKRYLFTTVIGIIPIAGGFLSLIDALLVFKADRRCLHDMVAGTQVLKFPPGATLSGEEALPPFPPA